MEVFPNGNGTLQWLVEAIIVGTTFQGKFAQTNKIWRVPLFLLNGWVSHNWIRPSFEANRQARGGNPEADCLSQNCWYCYAAAMCVMSANQINCLRELYGTRTDWFMGPGGSELL